MITKREYYSGQNFWQHNRKGQRPMYPISNDIIREAEALLRVRFPASFKDLMKEQNGGELNFPCFNLPPTNIEYLADKAQLLPSIEPIHFEKDDISILSSKELINASQEMIEDEHLPDGLVVLWTDFHHWIVFDYRIRKENPSILYIVEDYISERITWKYIKVADSFDNFLRKLHRELP
jgi:hypothetical protein